MTGGSTPHVVGIDVGGTHLRVLAAQGTARSQVLVAGTPGGLDGFVEQVVQGAAGCLRSLRPNLPEPPRPTAAVVGLPCQTDGGRVRWAPNLPFLEGVDLSAVLAERLGTPVDLVLDGQAALVAELAEGAAYGRSNALLVSVGTGIGGALAVAGRVVRGAHGLAGAVGWLLDTDSEAAGEPDDRHGRWEQRASGSALVRLARPWGGVDRLAAAARDGDPDATAALHGYAVRLGRGIGSLASLLDPEIVVLAGGVAALFDLLEPGLRMGRADSGSPAAGDIPLVPAACGSSVGVIGCLHIATGREWLW